MLSKVANTLYPMLDRGPKNRMMSEAMQKGGGTHTLPC